MVERDATATLKRAGFVVKTAVVDLGEDVAPGRTVMQSPAAGETAPAGSTVWIEITKGSPASKTPIPDLRGFGVRQATDDLEEMGFTVTTRLTAPPAGSTGPDGSAWAGGQVWRTTPGPGELAADGAIVLDYAPQPAPPTTAPPPTATEAPPQD
jgi:beta-lactam-binding protein with PASTA domain